MDQVTVSRELLRQVLDALREIAWSNDSKWQSDRAQGMTEPLREALEQPAVEPVAWRTRCTDPLSDWVLMYRYPKTEEQFSNIEIQPLYTAPQAQRPAKEKP